QKLMECRVAGSRADTGRGVTTGRWSRWAVAGAGALHAPSTGRANRPPGPYAVGAGGAFHAAAPAAVWSAAGFRIDALAVTGAGLAAPGHRVADRAAGGADAVAIVRAGHADVVAVTGGLGCRAIAVALASDTAALAGAAHRMSAAAIRRAQA